MVISNKAPNCQNCGTLIEKNFYPRNKSTCKDCIRIRMLEKLEERRYQLKLMLMNREEKITRAFDKLIK